MRLFFTLLVAGLAAGWFAADRSRADIPPPYEIYGIGAGINEAEPYPKLSGVAMKGPAALAGAKEGDGVIAIDGTYAKSGVPFYYFARGLGGRQGSTVELVLLRDGRQVLVVKVVRSARAHSR